MGMLTSKTATGMPDAIPCMDMGKKMPMSDKPLKGKMKGTLSLPVKGKVVAKEKKTLGKKK